MHGDRDLLAEIATGDRIADARDILDLRFEKPEFFHRAHAAFESSLSERSHRHDKRTSVEG